MVAGFLRKWWLRLSGVSQPAKPLAIDGEQLYHLLAGMIPNTTVLVFDHNQHFTHAEGPALAAVGANASMLVGRHPSQLWPADIVAAYADSMIRTLQGERLSFSVTYEDRHYALYTVPIQAADGLITGGIMVVVDETEVHQEREDLRKARQVYDSLFEQNNDAVFILDLEGRHLAVNHCACDMLGYPPEELIHLGAPDIIVANEHGHRAAILQRMLAGDAIPVYERHFRRKDGQIITAEINVALVRDTDSTPMHIQSIARDITERKRAEEALRLSEARYRAIVEFQTELVCRYRPDTTLTFANAAYCQYYGVRPEDIIGKSFLTLIPESDRPNMRELLQETWKAVDTRSHEYESVLPDGSRRWQAWVDRVIRDDSGTLLEVQAVGRDITDLKHAQQRAQELEMEQERSRVLNHFVQTAMHEFRTPLTVIYNSAYLMNNATAPSAREEHLIRIEKQINLLTRLLDMLLEMTRLNYGIQFDLVAQDVNDTVRHSLDAIRSAASAKNLALSLDLSPGPLTVALERERFTQALAHLLDNAVRYTPDGGHITLRTYAVPDFVAVEVVDTGNGITSENLRQIFTPFWRVDVAHTTPGFGLGLSIARRIIEYHQGRIDVDSLPGQGSRFTILLPRPD